MTSGEIALIITGIGTVGVQLINAWRTPSKSVVNEIHEKADEAIRQNNEIEKKAIEIKTQTNGNHSELVKKMDILIEENNSLREKNVTLEKAMIALAANNRNEPRQVRLTDRSVDEIAKETTK